MSTYWLSRNGGKPEGPFEEFQLRGMWGRGNFSAADHLCAQGSEEWLPAEQVIALIGEQHWPALSTPPAFVPGPPIKKPTPQPKRAGNARARAFWNWALFTLAVLSAVGAVLFFMGGTEDSPYDSGMYDAMQSAKEWTAQYHPRLNVRSLSPLKESGDGRPYRALELDDRSKYKLYMKGKNVTFGQKVEEF